MNGEESGQSDPKQESGETSEQFEPNLEQKLEAEKILVELLKKTPSQEESNNINNIISHSEFLAVGSEYSIYWERVLNHETDSGEAEKLSQIFIEKLVGKTMIDLGGGRENMRQILGNSGFLLKCYINVDKHQFENDTALNKRTLQGFQFGVSSRVWLREKDINRVEINAEMLDFLQYIGDNSVDAIALNGIDTLIADGRGYHKELGKQIQRVLKVGGILFGYGSRAIELLIRDKDFSDKWEKKWKEDNSEVQILEKK